MRIHYGYEQVLPENKLDSTKNVLLNDFRFIIENLEMCVKDGFSYAVVGGTALYA